MDPFHSEASGDETEVSSQEAARERRKTGGLLGRYVVLEELGRGGMSVVYVAYDPQLDRRVALKVVRGDKLSAAHRARLHREAQALARLSHPNVVTVFDVGDIVDDTFVAMELVDGMNLRDWQKQARTWRETVRVLVAAGRGLAAAHAAGIVHRDVKPHNILIGTSGQVKLVDFGLARDLGDRSNPDLSTGEIDPLISLDDSGTHSMLSITDSASKHLETITLAGHVVGTPAYMPPEQRARRPEADERSDQFSFCVTLYEALYKQRPYQISKKELLDRGEQLTRVDRPGVEPRTLAQAPPENSDVPAWLRKVVLRGLAAEPRHRYPSVDALLVELDRDPQRTRRRIAVAGAAALAVAGVAALVTWKMSHGGAGPTCSDGGDRVATVWNANAKQDIARDATRLQVPWADGAVTAFADGVDRWAGNWKAMHLEACRATKIRGEQSAEALDLRMACLDRRLREVGALVELMRTADVETMRNAGDAVENLPPVADCGDVTSLRLVTPRPTDPSTVRKVDALETDLARLGALYAVGNVTKTLELADRVIASARAVGFAPTLARALYWRGRAIADRDGGPEAEAAFDEVFATALGAGDDKMAADAAARVAQEELWSAHLADFQRWERIAHALATRVGATDLILWIDQLGCMSNHWVGKVITRLACLRELAARRDKLNLPSEWLMTTLGISASEAGDFSGAIGWLERGVQMAASENGADHPRTLEMRAYLCHGLNELGDYTRSVKECGDALATLRRVAPDDKTLIARTEEYLGEAQSELGHAELARPLLTDAVATGDDEIKADATAALGDLAGARGDTAADLAARRASLDEVVKMYEPFNPHHPNIIGARHELGAALLGAGKFDEAAAVLGKADAEVDVTEISPLELAELRFARSKAVAKAHPPDLALARRLAESARDLYVHNAPDTERFRSARRDVDQWLESLDKSSKD